MTHFVDLLESGREADNDFAGERVGEALQALVEKAQTDRQLDAEGVWRLHRRVGIELLDAGASAPPGGWRALCALAVGTGVLRAKDDAFVAGPLALDDWCDDGDEVRRRLVEGYTRWLIPPATAAGLFLAMDVHPLWGLRLARRLHVDAPMIDGAMEGWRDEELLPDGDLDELRRGVFCSLSVIFSGLRKLEPHRRYCADVLQEFVGEAIEYGRERIEPSGEGLNVLIGTEEESGPARARSSEFAAGELFDGVLVPAGVMRRYDDETCGVDAQVLESVRVGHLGRDAQRDWFRRFLLDRNGEAVA